MPSFKTKLFFWIVLGVISTYFAEVMSGSMLFPTFRPLGLLFVVPLYLLHIVLLSGIIYRCGRPTWRSLVAAGALFGLYEAYITKILWNPTWGQVPFKLAGVAAFEFVILVLFWHMILSFIVPLVVAESSLTKSSSVAAALPKRLSAGRFSAPLAVVLAAGFLSIFHSSAPLLPSVASAVLDSAAVTALIWLWRKKVGAGRYSLPELLPNGKEMKVIGILLAAMYLFMAAFNRPEAFPSLVGHVSILCLYAVFIYLFVRALKAQPAFESFAPGKFSFKRFWLFALALAAFSVLPSTIPAVRGSGVAIGWVALCLWAVYNLVVTFWPRFKKSNK
jgi:hypothetical protein